MFDDITKLARIAAKPERHILGLMSGTSLDGRDIALCRVKGARQNANRRPACDTQPVLGAFHCRIDALDESGNATVVVSGGGACNPTLMANIRRELSELHKVVTTEEIGIDPDAKKAALVAVLANETVAGTGLAQGRIAGTPSVATGKISLPGYVK